jgi:nucleoid DNA-binding protein
MRQKIEKNKKWFIREVAHRAGFTIKDTQEMWNACEEVLKELIKNREELMLDGLFKLWIQTIPPHLGAPKGRKPGKDKYEKEMLGEAYKIHFTTSRNLLDLLKNND